MKKLLLVLFVLVVSVSCLFAWQETFSYDSVEYKEALSFARLMKAEVGTFVTPITRSHLLEILHSLPSENLTEEEKARFDEFVYSLENPSFDFEFNLVGMDIEPLASPELSFHTNNDIKYWDWEADENGHLIPFFELQGKVSITEHFTGYIGVDYAQSPSKVDYSKGTIFNFSSISYSDNTFPHKAYGAVGFDHFELIVGRDRLTMGKGETGNLTIGDGLWFEDFAKLSIFTDNLTYGFTMISFDNSDGTLEAVRNSHLSTNQLVVLHSLSFNYKWASLSLHEGVLQYGDNILSDLRFLNPFFILHNTNGFCEDTQNNFFGLELNLTPFKGIEFNFQAIFDQIQLSNELDDGEPSANMPPNAYGLLANVKGTKFVNNGIFNWYIEGVYTSPALYLKETSLDNGVKYYNVDLIVNNWLWSGDSDIQYLGYKYGPDTKVISLGASYFDENNDEYSFDATLSVHGIRGIRRYSSQKDWADVGPDYFYDKTPTHDDSTLPEYRLVLTASADYELFDCLDLTSTVAFVNAWNYQNVIGKTVSDLQISLGVRIDSYEGAIKLYRVLFNK